MLYDSLITELIRNFERNPNYINKTGPFNRSMPLTHRLRPCAGDFNVLPHNLSTLALTIHQPTDFISVLKISKQAGIYAYDAYFLDCAVRQKAPLLTLDRRLKASAHDFNIKTMEV